MTDALVVQQGDAAVFVYPISDLSSEPVYLGTFSKYFLQGISQALGSVTPIYGRSDKRPRESEIIDFSYGAPELGELSILEHLTPVAKNYIEIQKRRRCPLVFLVKIDQCGEVSDLASWQSILMVERVIPTNIEFSEFDTNEAEKAVVEVTGTYNFVRLNRVLPIRWAVYAETNILAEVLAVAYSDDASCGVCAKYSSGCQSLFALTASNSGSPGLSSQLVYSVDGFSTFNTQDIPTLGGLSGSDMGLAGKYIIVVSEADGAHHYANKNNIGSWVRVSAGYVGAPRAVFVKSPHEVFMTGAGGYIYKTLSFKASVKAVHNGAQTVQNGNDIHGAGQVIVSVHDQNTVMLSTNNGESFGLLVTDAGLNGPDAGFNLTAVAVRGAFQWYIGTSGGNLFYTEDQGATFTTRALPDQANIVNIWDIQFSEESPEIGAIAVETTSGGKVFRTFDGGRSWFDDTPSINAIPVNDRIRSVALCGINSIAAGGIKDSSTDGILAVAQ